MSDFGRQSLEEITLGTVTQIYAEIMKSWDLESADGLYVVRLWDGMDGEWMDLTPAIPFDAAFREWYQRTEGGETATSYDDLDYYRIFPADTRMYFSDGNEMCRPSRPPNTR